MDSFGAYEDVELEVLDVHIGTLPAHAQRVYLFEA